MECFGWSRRELLEQRQRLEALARQLVADEHRAQDLVQETLLASLRVSGRAIRAPAAWMAQLLRRRALQVRREEERRRLRHERVAVPDRAEAPDGGERFAALRAVVGALDELEEPYRSTVILRYFEGLPPREIAARRRIPVRTVNTRLARGLSQLRGRLDREYGGDSRAWVALLAAPLGRRDSAPPAERPAAGTPPGLRALTAVLALAAAGGLLIGLGPFRGGGEPPRPAPEPSARAAAGESSAAPAAAGEEDGNRRVVAREAEAPPLEQPAGRVVAGRVLDLEGRPLHGLDVHYELGRRTQRAGWRASGFQRSSSGPEATTSTGADGSFELGLTAGDSGWIVARGDDWVPVVAELVPVRTSGPVELRAARPRELSGIVLDQGGRAVPDALVRFAPPDALLEDWGRRGATWLLVVPEARSGADGRFRIPAAYAVAGPRLIAHKPGFEESAVALTGEGPWEVEVRLRSRAPGRTSLRGLVLGEDGAPVPHTWVAAENMLVRADGDGAWELPALGDDRPARLYAYGPGRLPAVRELGAEEASRDIVLQLGPEARAIGGRVLDRRGEPLVGHLVWVLDPTPLAKLTDGTWLFVEGVLHPTSHERLNVVETDATGAFRLLGLLDRDYTLGVMHPDTLLFAQSDPRPAGTADLKLMLPDPQGLVRVAGRLVDVHGDPLAAVRVEIRHLIQNLPAPDGTRIQRSRAGEATSTGADGAFELSGTYSRGSYLTAMREGFEPAICELTHVEAPGSIELVLARQVLVRFELGGEPAEGRALTLHGADGSRLPVRPAASTGFTISLQRFESIPVAADGTSGLYLVPETAVEARLTQDGREVARHPLHLAAEGTNLIRL